MTAILGASIFGAIVVLYIALFFGAPLGEYAMGGNYKVLPPKSRIMIAVSVVIQVFGIVALLQMGSVVQVGLPVGVVKVTCYVFAVYLTLNVLMNIFSRSKKERWVMTPLSAIVAACYWITVLGI